MEVRLAESAGFCWGVKRTMEMALSEAHRLGRPLQTYGPLVHNNQAVAMLQTKGISAASAVAELEADTVIVRAHGLPPEEMEAVRGTGRKVIDGTCPLVVKVHKIIARYARQGFHTIIVGDRHHAEARGLLGYTEGRGVCVESIAEIDALPRDFSRVLVVSQTTQGMEFFDQAVARIKQYYPQASIHNTICDPTVDRQTGLVDLTEECDLIVVIGGRHSANTMRLAQISRELGRETVLVETADELEETAVAGHRLVGVTAGASTPSWVITSVVDRLEALGRRSESPLYRRAYDAAYFLVKSHLATALGAVALGYACWRLVAPGLAVSGHSLVAAACCLFAHHLIQRYTDGEAESYSDPAGARFYAAWKRLLWPAALLGLVAAVLLTLAGPRAVTLLVGASALIGILYHVQVLPQRWKPVVRLTALRDVPMSKDLSVALGWSVLLAGLPALAQAAATESGGGGGAGVGVGVGPVNWAAAGVAWFFVFTLIFVRSALADIQLAHGDRIAGRNTIAVLIGKEWTKVAVAGLLLAAAAVLALAAGLGWASTLAAWLLAGVGYSFLYLYLYHRRAITGGLKFEFALEFSSYLCGLVALA
ncbi:MAG: 4-hydroxy-3-methylbut-2-enyl diphosphate reductase [Planctomycetes bacterium]|nr:4-hydroxy-3-methylbut-2-enyl diphosphate reductase [Planctomycetota bacterium]